MMFKKLVIYIVIIILTITILVNYSEINKKNDEIRSIGTKIDIVKDTNEQRNNEVNSLKNDLSQINSLISSTESDITNIKNDIDLVKSDISYLENTSHYTLHDPSYWEVENFILQDTTNTNPYNLSSYNCADYAADINNIADKKGIRCAYVSLSLSGPVGHAIVAFNVSYKGVIYYDPMEDRKVTPEIGKYYWADCVPAPPGYYYEKDSNDIINGITLYW